MININPTSFGLGALFGTGIGVFSTRRFLKEKLRAEIMKEAEAEVASMREFFEAKEIALKERVAPQTAEEIVRERGYAYEPYEPPSVRALRPPVPVREPRDEDVVEEIPPVEKKPEPQTVFYPLDDQKWDWKNEMLTRTGSKPYVIHHTEMQEMQGFEETSYIYYPVDNVLIDEDGQPIEKVGEAVGLVALDSFGHGSEDPNVVFVRNNALHLHIEIQRLPGRSYAVDVLGLSDDHVS